MFCFDSAVGEKYGGDDDGDLAGDQPDVGGSERAVWGTLRLNSNAWVDGWTWQLMNPTPEITIECNDVLTEMCEHEQKCDEENHPARDDLRRDKESQPGETNLGEGRLDRIQTSNYIEDIL